MIMASPNFNEMQTTTKQNRSGVKKAQKNAQAGVPVPERAFSSEAKEKASAGTSGTKKGSLTFAKSLPTESGSSTPVPQKKSWENSSEDSMADYRQARRRGQSTEDYEDSSRDRISDVAGQRRMNEEESKKADEHGGTHYRGKPAFANPPKTAHGFGHTASNRDGNLRNSGHPSAHRIGKKGNK
jgi:hypothetical protein